MVCIILSFQMNFLPLRIRLQRLPVQTKLFRDKIHYIQIVMFSIISILRKQITKVYFYIFLLLFE